MSMKAKLKRVRVAEYSNYQTLGEVGLLNCSVYNVSSFVPYRGP